ncbi:hypothetical protein [Rothia nasimurium]|uniref:hypothetical protein n=1 Tax=Rothia nasimurium TaxID=85336 RepID=UPI001F3A7D78|nr:hypothetical protein [Rothia nasimurium]
MTAVYLTIFVIFGFFLIQMLFALLESKSRQQPPTFIGYLPLSLIGNNPKILVKTFLSRFLIYCIVFTFQIGTLYKIAGKDLNISNYYYLLVAILASGTHWIHRNYRPFLIEFRKFKYFLFHLVALSIPITASIFIWILFIKTDLIIRLSPSWDSLIDNAWGSLFVALVLIWYFNFFQQPESVITREEKVRIEKEDRKHQIINTELLNISKKYNEVLRQASLESSNYLYSLLVSILIFENLNRPSIIRYFENLFVRLTGIESTVGIGQVHSKQPLSDSESIEILLNNITNLHREYLDIDDILIKINNCKTFSTEVKYIFEYISSDNLANLAIEKFS